MTQTLTIEQDGGKIKGTVDGNKIAFTVKRTTPRGQMTINYTGTVDGDSIKGSMQADQFSRDWTATRQK